MAVSKMKIWRILCGLGGIFILYCSSVVFAFTANKVWFEFRPNGLFRVYVAYTVPELKEFRESYIDFTKKKDAEKFYWSLVRGADFFPSDPKNLQFIQPPQEPTPW